MAQLLDRGLLPAQHSGSKKQREIYVGNLAAGQLTAGALGDLFTSLAQALPSFDETLFLHPASGTLISADLVLAIPPELKHWWTQLYLRMAGIHGQTMGCSLVHKLEAKDKPALRAGVDTILEQDFGRLIVSHASVVDVPDLKDQIRESWSWLK